MGNKVTFTQLTELVLTRMHDLGEKHGHGGYSIDMVEVALELGAADDDTPLQVAQTLSDQGLVKCAFALGGTAHGHITGQGRLLVEAGGRTGIIAKFRAQPSHFVTVINSPGANVNTGHLAGSQSSSSLAEVQALLDAARAALRTDGSLSNEAKADTDAELRIVSTQLEKSKPDKTAIQRSLDTMGRVSSIGSFLLKVGELLHKLL